MGLFERSFFAKFARYSVIAPKEQNDRTMFCLDSCRIDDFGFWWSLAIFPDYIEKSNKGKYRKKDIFETNHFASPAGFEPAIFRPPERIRTSNLHVRTVLL